MYIVYREIFSICTPLFTLYIHAYYILAIVHPTVSVLTIPRDGVIAPIFHR